MAERSGRSATGTIVIAIAVVLAWALLRPGVAAADEPLRWKFRAGETLRFSIEQKMTMDTKAMGVDRKSNRTHTLDFSWKVLSVAATGEAEISHRTERIRMKAEEPPYLPFDFDSATAKDPQAGFEGLTKMLKSEVGAEFTFRMKPNGEIVDVKIPEATLKQFRDAAPTTGPGSEVTEKSLKETLLQSSPPSFPEQPLEVGKTWTSPPSRVPLPPAATLIMERTFTYQGPDPNAPNLLRVGIETAAKLEPIGGTEAKATIRKQEGKGSMTVDAGAGRVTGTRNTLKLEIVVTVGTGQTIEQSTESTSTMTLLP